MLSGAAAHGKEIEAARTGGPDRGGSPRHPWHGPRFALPAGVVSSLEPSLPPEFVARLRAIVPDDPPGRLDRVLGAFTRDKPTCARHNPLRGPLAAARDALLATGATLTELGLGPGTWRVDHPDRRAVTDSPAVNQGLVHLQNPSSWIPVLALGIVPDDQVLDLCAAPGGKTLHLASLLGPGGHLAAVEPVRDRFFRLRGVLERGGALAPAPDHPSLRLFMKDGRSVGGAVPARFDKILVDAPCSSEARFDASDPTTFATWSPKKIATSAHKQKALLRSGLAALKPGGALVYSTCSLAPEENEAVVLEVLAELGDSVSPTPILPRLPAAPPDWMPGLMGLDLALRVLPGPVWDAFFLVRLERS